MKSNGDPLFGGPDYIHHILSTTENPLETIRDFQSANTVDLPSYSALLGLTDQFSFRRSDINSIIFKVLEDRLLARMAADDDKKGTLRKLAKKYCRCLRIKEMQKILLSALNGQSSLTKQQLEMLSSDYDNLKGLCPIEVKRLVWQMDSNGIFRREIREILEGYISEQKRRLLSLPHDQPFLRSMKSDIPGQIGQLCDLIGENWGLYDIVVECLTKQYVESGERMFCSMRCEVLMELARRNVRDVVSGDPCHTLVRRIRTGDDDWDRAVGDLDSSQLMLVLSDIYNYNNLLTSIVECNEDLTGRGRLPRESKRICDLVSLLVMTSNCDHSTIVTQTLPLISNVSEDIRAKTREISRLKQSQVPLNTCHSITLPPALLTLCQSDVTSVRLLYSFLEHKFSRKAHPHVIIDLLPSLPRFSSPSSFDLSLLQLTVHSMFTNFSLHRRVSSDNFSSCVFRLLLPLSGDHIFPSMFYITVQIIYKFASWINPSTLPKLLAYCITNKHMYLYEHQHFLNLIDHLKMKV